MLLCASYCGKRAFNKNMIIVSNIKCIRTSQTRTCKRMYLSSKTTQAASNDSERMLILDYKPRGEGSIEAFGKMTQSFSNVCRVDTKALETQ